MSTRLRHLDTLRSLDPLGQPDAHGKDEDHGLFDEHRVHARLLALATAYPHPAPASRQVRRSVRDGRALFPRRWVTRSLSRWVTAGALALVVSTAALVLPTGSPQTAFASWSSMPVAVADADADADADAEVAGQRCRDNNVDENKADSPMVLSNAGVQRMRTVLAERRGDDTYTLIEGSGWIAECLQGDGLGGGVLARAGDVDLRTGWSLVPAVDGAVILTGGTQRTGNDVSSTYHWVTGRVGSDVTGVGVTPSGEGVVTATLSNGYFTAWWPGGRSDTAEVTLHLADGRTLGGIPADPIVSHYEGGPA
jgi:hypothetical protein